MDNLDRLYSHLIHAQDAVFENRLSEAKMFLMASGGLLKPFKDDYSDVKRMYRNIQNIKTLLEKRISLYRDEKEKFADDIEVLIGECAAWMDCRRRAA